MGKYILYFAFLPILLSCGAMGKRIAPPGMLRLNDSLFVDQYPTTTFQYLEFLNSVSVFWSDRTSDSLQKMEPYGYTDGYLLLEGPNLTIASGKTSRKKAYDAFSKPFYGSPDSILFQSLLEDDILFLPGIKTSTFILHPAYRDFPMVNVTPAQAATFCKWRADMVKLYLALNVKDSADYEKKYEKIIRYRLATHAEWEAAVKKANINFSEHEDYGYLWTDPLVPVSYYDQKKYDFPFYSFPEHLSEIIANDSIVQLNWQDNAGQADFVRPFEGISPGVGFRCVCEVEK
jgi:hypothetical protein